MFDVSKNVVFLQPQIERFSVAKRGALAQLARALAWHARGHRFDSVMLHKTKPCCFSGVFCFWPTGVLVYRMLMSFGMLPLLEYRPFGMVCLALLPRRFALPPLEGDEGGVKNSQFFSFPSTACSIIQSAILSASFLTSPSFTRITFKPIACICLSRSASRSCASAEK